MKQANTTFMHLSFNTDGDLKYKLTYIMCQNKLVTNLCFEYEVISAFPLRRNKAKHRAKCNY